MWPAVVRTPTNTQLLQCDSTDGDQEYVIDDRERRTKRGNSITRPEKARVDGNQ